MNAIAYRFPVYSHVTIVEGAFKGCPAFVVKHHVSTVTGYPCPAYRLEISDHEGRQVESILREEWLSELGDSLYLIEFYVKNPATGEDGWDINLAWVRAKDSRAAQAKLRAAQGSRFDCVIQATEQHAITALAGSFRVNTPDANLFILN